MTRWPACRRWRRPRYSAQVPGLSLLRLTLATAVATCVEVAWVSPDGPSADDMSPSFVADLPLFCVLAALATVGAALLLRRLGPAATAAGICSAMLPAWFAMNYREIDLRWAAWSTFTDQELLHDVLRASAIPFAACSAALFVAIYAASRLSR